MEMEKYRYLFTPEAEFIPEKGVKYTVLIDMEYEISVAYSLSKGNWRGEDGIRFRKGCVTHVLDLSKLTTKSHASDVLEEACREAYTGCEWIEQMENVVQKYKSDL